jgi:hypothetical protein
MIRIGVVIESIAGPEWPSAEQVGGMLAVAGLFPPMELKDARVIPEREKNMGSMNAPTIAWPGLGYPCWPGEWRSHSNLAHSVARPSRGVRRRSIRC